MPDHARTRAVGVAAVIVAVVACSGPKAAGVSDTTHATSIAAAPGVPMVSPGDWPSYNRTLDGDRFSPLSEITRTNVTQLKSICTYNLPEVSSLQTGPIVVRGTMYFTTDTISYAINASTCTERWKQPRHNAKPSALLVNRGFAYMDGRLFRGTSDSHVLAMDTTDGRVLWDHVISDKAPGTSIPMAPVAARGLVFVGNAGGDQVGVTGHVYALDARDGHVVWRFDVVPDSGPARATWTNTRIPVTGGGFWTSFTYDTARKVLYVPAGNPAPDFEAELRTGDNLYTNAVIALDAATGKMLGYNQLVKHDTHDWDVDSPPTLVTTHAGQSIVASANKDGQLAVLDRSQIATGTTVSRDLGAALPVLYRVPTTTIKNADVPLARDSTTLFCPGITGGSEWNGAAYSPNTNSLYVGTVDWCARVQLKRDTMTIPEAGTTWLGNENKDTFGPASEARGWLTSFDADSGTVRWKFHASHPMLAGVTPTAGGLVFAADMAGELYAFGADSGHVLWKTNTGQSTGGGVISYSAGGRQLVAVASGMKSSVWPGAAKQSRILVYGLR